MFGIYVHIPFCIKKCAYCDFVSFPVGDGAAVSAYIGALESEIRLLSEKYGKLNAQTVFIGGGTPSILPSGSICSIVSALRNAFIISDTAEITIEANPGTLSSQKCNEYINAGINRLSIGLQSTCNSLLSGIGRIHTYEDFIYSFQTARDAGFRNINIDTMYGLPNQTVQDWLHTVEKVINHAPEHISAYSLILEKDTRLYFDVKHNKTPLPDEDAEYIMHTEGRSVLEQAGYARYEISNYALNGKECRHNINYWNNGEYLGIGLNAHSAMRCGGWTRLHNTESLNRYMDSVSNQTLPVDEVSVISTNEEMFETLMLGLRKIEGVSREAFVRRFGRDILDVYPNAIKKTVESGWLTTSISRIKLTDTGLDMQNSVLQEFI